MNSRVLVVSVGLLTGVLGFLVGRFTEPSAPSPDSPVAAVAPRLSSTGADRGNDAESPRQSSAFQSGDLGAGASAPAPLTTAEFESELEKMQSSGWGTRSIRRSVQLLDRIAVSDVASIARDLLAKNDPSGRNMAGAHFVMSVYAEQDADGAWAFANSLPPGQNRNMAIMLVTATIAGQNPERALALAESITDADSKNNVIQQALASLSVKDPKRAFTLAQPYLQGGDPDRARMLTFSLFNQWATSDLEGARAAAAQLSGDAATQAGTAIVQALAQTNPEEAWKIASSMPPAGRDYGDPRLQMLSTWTQKDPGAAMRAAMSVTNADIRQMAVSQVVQNWARTDFDTALHHALAIENSTDRAGVLQAMSGADGNPDKMLTAVLEYMPPGDSFRNAVSQIFSNWARQDPKKAAEAVFRLPPGNVSNQAASQVASNWARSGDPAAVLAWSRKLPEGEIRRSALNGTFEQWSAKDPASARSAAGNLPDAERRWAEASVADGWSERDPKAVADWAATIPDESHRRDIMRRAVRNWSQASPEDAAEYVERLPAAERDAAIDSVVDRWSSRDVLSAQAWLEKQPAGPGKNDAIRSLTRRVAEEDPAAALALAATITDVKSREQQRERIARTWLRNEPAAARNWIASSDLEKEARERLLK